MPHAATRVHGGDSVLRGIFYLGLAVALFPMQNATAKYLGTRYPLAEILWARYTVHLLCCVLFFGPRFGRSLFRTRHPGQQAVRAALLFLGSVLVFTGLRTLELPTVAAIGFVAPILVTALSGPLLGENVGWRRWLAVLAGFVGALIIIRPGFGVMKWGAVLVLLNAVAYALYQIISRRVGADDAAPVSNTLTGIGGVVLATPLLAFTHLRLPDNGLDVLLFATIGVWGVTAHLFVTKAYQWSAASVIAPISYGELIGATVLGLVLFHQFPDAPTWAGAAIIIAAGFYITLRERRRRPNSPS